ncbi:MAG TPA: hypothetical protein VI357_11510 [Mycobacteriales bacterium]
MLAEAGGVADALVVLVSSDISASNAATARRVGACGFVAKVDLLENRLRRLVDPGWRP